MQGKGHKRIKCTEEAERQVLQLQILTLTQHLTCYLHSIHHEQHKALIKEHREIHAEVSKSLSWLQLHNFVVFVRIEVELYGGQWRREGRMETKKVKVSGRKETRVRHDRTNGTSGMIQIGLNTQLF